jgi:hypothetical protein
MALTPCLSLSHTPWRNADDATPSASTNTRGIHTHWYARSQKRWRTFIAASDGPHGHCYPPPPLPCTHSYHTQQLTHPPTRRPTHTHTPRDTHNTYTRSGCIESKRPNLSRTWPRRSISMLKAQTCAQWTHSSRSRARPSRRGSSSTSWQISTLCLPPRRRRAQSSHQGEAVSVCGEETCTVLICQV